MTRRTIGLGILALWIIGLALLYRRSTFRTPEQSLVEAGMRVSPSTYYYRLEQGGSQIGAVSSAIDTTTTLLTATDFVRAAVPAGRDTFHIQVRSEARFTRALSLKDFILGVDGPLTPFRLRGVVQGEGKTKTLQVTTETRKRHPTTAEYELAGLVFVPTVAPLPLMLEEKPAIGRTLQIGVFDPMSQSIRNVTLKVEKDSVFSVPDSASLDSTTQRWVVAHTDTIHGWLVSGDVPTATAWVDESGRMIMASEPGGISMMRTTFEMAFENWRLDTKAKPAPSERGIKQQSSPSSTRR